MGGTLRFIWRHGRACSISRLLPRMNVGHSVSILIGLNEVMPTVRHSEASLSGQLVLPPKWLLGLVDSVIWGLLFNAG